MTKEADIKRMVDDRQGEARRRRHPGEQCRHDVFGPVRGARRRRDEEPARDQAVRLHARDPAGLSDDEGAEVGPHRQHRSAAPARSPIPYMFGSGMTNAALLNLTKSLSTEFGEDNVLVNAICPGWVDTNLWRTNAEGLRAGARRASRGGSAAAGGAQEFAQPVRQARGARQRHRVPVLGARELHHRRVAQPRWRADGNSGRAVW